MQRTVGKWNVALIAVMRKKPRNLTRYKSKKGRSCPDRHGLFGYSMNERLFLPSGSCLLSLLGVSITYPQSGVSTPGADRILLVYMLFHQWD